MHTDTGILDVLREGEIISCTMIPSGSNYTFLVKIRHSHNLECMAVYKPRDGEVPLWDFMAGTLYKREYAAYLLSVVLGWHFIPETIIRDGPYGVGSFQRYIDHYHLSNYYTVKESFRDDLKIISCFDLIANNADRKGSHFFEGEDGLLWGIDHGLTFHKNPKLRTVIDEFWGEKIPIYIIDTLKSFLREIKGRTGYLGELHVLLDKDEIQALIARVRWIISNERFPTLS